MKRITKIILAMLLATVMLAAPAVSAYASGRFSGSLRLMNSLPGQISVPSNISSGSISVNAVVTSINVTMQYNRNNIDPFFLVITSPNNTQRMIPINLGTTSVTVNDFNGHLARGTWVVQILHRGTPVRGVSTVNGGTFTVNFR